MTAVNAPAIRGFSWSRLGMQLIALDVAAAIVYAKVCNWRMALYWVSAATLTACVTYTRGGAA